MPKFSHFWQKGPPLYANFIKRIIRGKHKNTLPALCFYTLLLALCYFYTLLLLHSATSTLCYVYTLLLHSATATSTLCTLLFTPSAFACAHAFRAPAAASPRRTEAAPSALRAGYSPLALAPRLHASQTQAKQPKICR